MKEQKEIDLGLKNAFDELFMTDEGRAENRLPKIYDIRISEIDPFPEHPFKVQMDEDMEQLVESIKDHGVITPVTLRKKKDGRYETISGHRRIKACELLGIDTIKAEIRDLDRDQAIIMMVESNFMRSKILPSEKAFSYKMRLEAMKRQGARADLTSCPVGTKSRSDERLAEAVTDSARQIQRYIRLTKLIPEILDMVDEGKIAFRPAVELSYLIKPEQIELLDIMRSEQATPSLSQAIRLKNLSKEGRLTDDVIYALMSEEKPNQKEKYTIKAEKLKRYIPDNIPFSKTEDYIVRALDFYQKHLNRQKGLER